MEELDEDSTFLFKKDDMKKERRLPGAEAFGVKITISQEPSNIDMEKLMASKKMKMANEVADSLLFANKPRKKKQA